MITYRHSSRQPPTAKPTNALAAPLRHTHPLRPQYAYDMSPPPTTRPEGRRTGTLRPNGGAPSTYPRFLRTSRSLMVSRRMGGSAATKNSVFLEEQTPVHTAYLVHLAPILPAFSTCRHPTNHGEVTSLACRRNAAASGALFVDAALFVCVLCTGEAGEVAFVMACFFSKRRETHGVAVVQLFDRLVLEAFSQSFS